MKQRLQKKWRNKRFKKVKKIDVEGETQQEFKPLVIVDGDDSKSGEMPVEIDFDILEDVNDLRIEGVDYFEVEYFLPDKGEAMVWIKVDNLEQGDQFKLVYGRKSRIAKLFDGFFDHDNTLIHEGPPEAIWHLEDDKK